MYSVNEILEQIDNESEIEDAENLEEHEDVTNNENEDEENKDKTTVKPKVTRKRGARPKLNAERLKGPRGIVCLEELFSNVKFKGKGHEKEDLNLIMSKMQYWCHRLYPKYTFDDCITQLEKLGSKKEVITLKKKIRYNMLDEVPITDEVDDNLMNSQEDQVNDDVMDTNDQERNENEFDKLLEQESRPLYTQQPVHTITQEQMEMIERNRQIAIEKRRKRLENQKQDETNIEQDEEEIEH